MKRFAIVTAPIIAAALVGAAIAVAVAPDATPSPCASVTPDSIVVDGKVVNLSCPAASSTSSSLSSTTSSTAVSTTSTTTSPSSTTSTTASTTTSPPTTNAPGAFTENFADPSALTTRFDHGWSGEWNAGALFGQAANDWMGDHDMSCGNPNLTMRTIHLTSAAQANDAAFYPCVFPGDAAKSHLMTSVNTEGYVTVWFAPKQVFTNVHRVCWTQNLTDMGGGKWVIVNFLTPAEYSGQTDLGYTSPDFPNNGGPSSPQGEALNGVKVFRGNMLSYTDGTFHGGPVGATTPDKAARFKVCVVDNENGTLSLSIAQPDGSTMSQTVSGAIPNGSVKVEFADDNYNPDKHFDAAGVPRNSTGLYTTHWDDITIDAS